MRNPRNNKLIFKSILTVLTFLTTPFVSFVSTNVSADVTSDLKQAIAKTYGGKKDTSVTVSIKTLTDGKVLGEIDAGKMQKPASVMKVLTSAAALKYLGPEFKFYTKIFLDGDTLRVEGGGDPSIVTESAWIIARAVKARGVDSVDSVELDPSYFESEKQRVGRRAYEAGSSALSMNFNSQSLVFCPALDGSGSSVVTLEPPNDLIKVNSSVKTVAGSASSIVLEPKDWSENYTAQGTIGASGDCEYIYRSVPEPAKFFGEVLLKCLKETGVTVKNGYKVVSGKSGGKPVYTLESKPFRQILVELNQYSNNFIAEQMVYALGCIGSKTCSRERGLSKIKDYLKDLGVESKDLVIVDGSGLDHDNRISTDILTKVLRDIFVNDNVSAEFEGSLSVGGRSGTLKSRKISPANTVVRAKTGTLTGVHALAGVLENKKGEKRIFAILQNGVSEPKKAYGLEKDILEVVRNS